ncbi:MAG TPA: hypothetical protein VF156_08575 [Agromyces sp.]
MTTIAALRPRLDDRAPHVRLGIAWAAVVVLALTVGTLATAVAFAAVALGAAGQACRAWRREGRKPYRPVAIAGAVLMCLGAAAGPVAVTAAAIVTGVASFAASHLRLGQRDWDAVLTASIALVVGIAGASVPLARAEVGVTAALVLATSVFAAEASWYVIGSGSRRWFEAPAAAVVAVAAVSIAVAAVLVPPFRGASPWVLGATALVLAPLGPYFASAILPASTAFAPALRRIDGFALVGPVWVLLASAMLDLR